MRRRQFRYGLQIGDVAMHDDILGQDLAVIHAQGRHIALGADLEEVRAALRLLVAADLVEFDRNAGFAKQDVRRQGAGAGRVVEFHLRSPLSER